MKDNFFEALTELSSPEDVAKLVVEHRVSDKFQRQADEQQIAAIAKAFGVIKFAQENGSMDKLVGCLKKKDAAIKSSDPYLVVLHSFIGYGPNGKQYASRDKANIQLLEAADVQPSAATEYIQQNGGLVACADMYRKAKKGTGIGSPSGSRKKHTLAAVRSEYLKNDDDVVVLVARLANKKVQIARKYPVGSMPDGAERKTFYKHVRNALKDYIADAEEGAPDE